MISSLQSLLINADVIRRFPPPAVPKGWSPDPRRVWEQDKENLKAGSTTQESNKQRFTGKDGRSVLSATEVRPQQ